MCEWTNASEHPLSAFELWTRFLLNSNLNFFNGCFWLKVDKKLKYLFSLSTWWFCHFFFNFLIEDTHLLVQFFIVHYIDTYLPSTSCYSIATFFYQDLPLHFNKGGISKLISEFFIIRLIILLGFNNYFSLLSAIFSSFFYTTFFILERFYKTLNVFLCQI